MKGLGRVVIGSAVEVYDGPAAPVWAAVAHKAMPDNGQSTINLNQQRQLQEGEC